MPDTPAARVRVVVVIAMSGSLVRIRGELLGMARK
jgi:hypothetical protein